MLPTPGKKCVNSFEEILPARKLRQARKAKIREKISKNLDRLDVPIDDLIEALDDEEEIDQEEIDQEDEVERNPEVQQEVPIVVLEHNDAIDDIFDFM